VSPRATPAAFPDRRIAASLTGRRGRHDRGRDHGKFSSFGTPAGRIRFLEMYEALGIEEVFLLCAIGPAQHEEVLHTLRLLGERVTPHFQARERPAAMAQASANLRVPGPHI
jgi:hypothetical protein